MEPDASQNPFASPLAPQKTRRDVPNYIEAMTPIDVRGYCYACGTSGEKDFRQEFYRGRLRVEYSLCRNCYWRQPWQRASILVNGSLSIAAILVMVYVVSLFPLIWMENIGVQSRIVNSVMVIGAYGCLVTAILVVLNIAMRQFAVFHWYPTHVGKGVFRLTALNRQFRLNYFKAEQDA